MVEVTVGLCSWIVKHRYSEFRELHEKVGHTREAVQIVHPEWCPHMYNNTCMALQLLYLLKL